MFERAEVISPLPIDWLIGIKRDLGIVLCEHGCPALGNVLFVVVSC